MSYTPISKNFVGESGEWQLSNGNCTIERNYGFHFWYAKTRSSRGAKLILPFERPSVPGLTRPLTRNLEIQRSTYLSQTPKNNEASATEFRRIWTKLNVGTIWSPHHGRLLPLIFNTHISFPSSIAVRPLTFVVLPDNIFWNGVYDKQVCKYILPKPMLQAL